MNLKQFVTELSQQGVKLWVEGEQLRVNAPKGVLTLETRELLTKHKAELILLLQQNNALAFAQRPESIATDTDLSIVKLERTQNLPLSFAQERIWLLNQLEPNNPFYNELAPLRLHGHLNIVALEQSLNKIIARHEALRTNFRSCDGQSVQIIAESLNLSVPVVDLTELSDEKREIALQQSAKAEAIRPFDLASSPLIRVCVLKLTEVEDVLLQIVHHIVFDGWSMGVFMRELSTIYSALCNDLSPKLPELQIQYADFAIWQRHWLRTEVLQTQLNYWTQLLKNAPTLLELPTDRPRPAIQTFRGTRQYVPLSIDLSEALVNFSRRSGVTLFVTLLSAFNVLLYRYTGSDDIVVGTPIANRNRLEIESLIGVFINTLVLRTDLSGNPSFEQLLSRVRKLMQQAYANSDLPFEELVKALQPQRSLSHTPLFQVMFVLQNAPKSLVEVPELTMSQLVIESTTAKFDLTLSMENTEAGLVGVWEYNTDLFDADTIERMTGHFQTLLTGIVANPIEPISALTLLSEVELQKLLVEWNSTTVEYPTNQCIHSLFESQAELTPQAVAVVYENQQLTYEQLNCRANQLAHYLRSLGVGPEVLVGICVERSLEMVVGLLGILKAGGAYVPLDPEYPIERLSFMLEDAAVSLLLTQHSLVLRLPEHRAQVFCLDDLGEKSTQNYQQNPMSGVRAFDLANVIYTSGSTGTPKGVMVTHTGLCNLAQAQIQTFGLHPENRILQFASLSFDASISEIVMALGSGATLYLGTKADLLPGMPLIQRLRDDGITHVTLPPSALSVLPVLALPTLQTMIVAGEACSVELMKLWSAGRNFFNAYGPTEATVCATVARYVDLHRSTSIGRPIANTQVYILDSNLQPVP
ncbi:MAG: condensation domain-containing protein, partial [Rhizonema sp. PD38]|nr:condensation domain-containing protein [Rhizonema sp. PD38]